MVPGFIISILTFPGVIVHEIAHQLFCSIFKVAILDVCYFRVGNPSGYVIHESPKESYKHLVIGIGPFFINTIIGSLIAAPSAISVMKFNSGNFLDYFLVWLGVSIAMHSFPSTGDAKNIWNSLKRSKNILVKIITVPIVGLIYLCSIGSVIWLDLLYGFTVAMFLPNTLILMFTK